MRVLCIMRIPSCALFVLKTLASPVPYKKKVSKQHDDDDDDEEDDSAGVDSAAAKRKERMEQ